jgi:hypothetical protein
MHAKKMKKRRREGAQEQSDAADEQPAGRTRCGRKVRDPLASDAFRDFFVGPKAKRPRRAEPEHAGADRGRTVETVASAAESDSGSISGTEREPEDATVGNGTEPVELEDTAAGPEESDEDRELELEAESHKETTVRGAAAKTGGRKKGSYVRNLVAEEAAAEKKVDGSAESVPLWWCPWCPNKRTHRYNVGSTGNIARHFRQDHSAVLREVQYERNGRRRTFLASMAVASRLRSERLKEREDEVENRGSASIIKGIESLKERMQTIKLKARLSFLLYTVASSHSFRSSDPRDARALHDFLTLVNDTQRKECPLATEMVLPRQEVRRHLLVLCNIIDRRTKMRLTGTGTGALAITADSYRNVAGRDILAITGHVLDAEFKPLSAVVGVKEVLFSQTSTALSASIEEDLGRVFGETRPYITSVVTDNAKNYLGAGHKLSSYSIGCFAHLLQLVVKDVVGSKDATKGLNKNAGTLRSLLKSVARFTTRFKKKKSTYRILESIRRNTGKKPLRPIARVATRWNSDYLMVQRYLELEKDYRKVGNVLKLGDKLHQPDKMANTRLRQYVDLMEPIYDLTTKMSAEKHPTLCSLPSEVHNLMHLIATKPQSGAKKALQESMKKRLLGIVSTPAPPLMAAALSPKYSDLSAVGATQDTMGGVYDMIAELSVKLASSAGKKVPTGWKKMILNTLELLRERFNDLRATTPADGLPTELDFWADLHSDPELHSIFASLFPVARALLAIPASSTPVERVFSVFTRIHTEKRMLLSTDTACAEVLVGSNYDRDWEPLTEQEIQAAKVELGARPEKEGVVVVDPEDTESDDSIGEGEAPSGGGANGELGAGSESTDSEESESDDYDTDSDEPNGAE